MSEHTQVKLRLTRDAEILSALRRVGAMRDAGEGKGKEHLSLQQDGYEYQFFHDREVIVPQPVAEHLYRRAGVLTGNDPLSDTQKPGLDVLEKWELGQEEPSKKSKTVCSVCGEEQGTVKKLVEHMASHVDEEEEKSPEPEE